LVDLGV